MKKLPNGIDGEARRRVALKNGIIFENRNQEDDPQAQRPRLATRSPGGPVNVGFTGPADLLKLIRNNPGLRKNVLARLSGLTERTVKRRLSQLKGKIEFRGAPKTGGYYVQG